MFQDGTCFRMAHVSEWHATHAQVTHAQGPLDCIDITADLKSMLYCMLIVAVSFVFVSKALSNPALVLGLCCLMHPKLPVMSKRPHRCYVCASKQQSERALKGTVHACSPARLYFYCYQQSQTLTSLSP